MPDLPHVPPSLLTGVIWCFWREEAYADPSTFNARVSEYGTDLCEPEPYSWDPSAVAVRVPRIRVKYFGSDPEDAHEYAVYEAVLESPDGKAFTNGELLFTLHNVVVHHLREVDHCHFEGLELVGTSGAGEPVYEMHQGS